VDPNSGIIYGVSIITAGLQARGHDLEVDGTTLSQMKSCADAMGTVAVKWNHKSGADAVSGYLKDFYVEENKLKGNWHLLKSHSNYGQAMEMAERMPNNVGLSAAFMGDDEVKRDGLDTKTFARCSELLSVDLVATPAANPDGMFEARLDGKPTASVDNRQNNQMPNAPTPTAAEPTNSEILAAITGLTSRIEAQDATIQQITDHLSAPNEPEMTIEEALTLSPEQVQSLLDQGLIDADDAAGIAALQAEYSQGDEPAVGDEPAGDPAPGESAPSATATALSALTKQVRHLSARFEREDRAVEDAQIEHQFSTIEKNMDTLALENETLRFALRTGGARAVKPAASIRMFEAAPEKKHEFESIVAEQVAAGKTKGEAVRFATKSAPGAYEAYMVARGLVKTA